MPRRRAANGAFYATRGDIAKDIDLSLARVGLLLGEVADSPGDSLVERWASTGTITWKIALR